MTFITNKFQKFILNRAVKKIKKVINCIETDLMDEFLELLLKIFRLVFYLNIAGFRENIKDFNARYTFRTEKGKIAASAIFKDDKMIVEEEEIPDTNVTVIFKDGKALWEFLMAGNPDVFAFVLANKLSYKGNLNYLMKFAYMAIHLKVMFGL